MPPAERPWRCFVAVPIGEGLRAALAGYLPVLKALPMLERGWRWTDPEAWHVTLAFLGATSPPDVPRLGRRLTDVAAAAAPFEIRSNGLGTFPSRGRARVLWYGFDDAGGGLRRLAHAVQHAAGLDREARFRAHLTLARARERFGAEVGELPIDPPPEGRLAVERLVLYRSHLGGGPARYEELAEAPLTGPAA